MKGLKFEDLLATVDFIYCGEANVFQENLDTFLSMAEELRLKGLMGQQDVSEKKKDLTPREMTVKPTFKRERSNLNIGQNNSTLEKEPPTQKLGKEKRIPIENFVSGDLQALDEKVKSMIEKSQNLISSGRKRADICKVCGKEGEGITIRDHIEANHLEGVSLPCDACGKLFRSRSTLRKHICMQRY